MENQNYNFISELDTLKDSWKLKVQILRIWKSTYSLDMIIMDKQDEKIQATIKMALCPTFEKVVEEGTIVFLSKFGVGEIRGKYPLLRHRYKVNFYRCTSVKRCSDFDGPLYGFNFFDFAEINNHLDDPNLLVDIIGCVIEFGNLEVYDKEIGKEGKRMDLNLKI